MAIINFGQETRNKLAEYGYGVEEISWIGSSTIQISIASFFRQADKFDYDNGYGSAKVPADIIIFMRDNNWFSRYEYDGLEWWKFNCIPKKPDTPQYEIEKFSEDYYWPQLVDFIVEE